MGNIGIPDNIASAIYRNRMRGATLTPPNPAGLWVALLEADPLNDLSNWQECSWTGYARQNVTMADDSPANGVGSNGTVVTFSPLADSTNPATHFAIMTVQAAGSAAGCELVGELSAPKDFVNGTDEVFNVGDLTANYNAN